MNMAHWWTDTDSGQPKYSEKTLSLCPFFYHKFHTKWPETELGYPRWEADN